MLRNKNMLPKNDEVFHSIQSIVYKYLCAITVSHGSILSPPFKEEMALGYCIVFVLIVTHVLSNLLVYVITLRINVFCQHNDFERIQSLFQSHRIFLRIICLFVWVFFYLSTSEILHQIYEDNFANKV